MTGKKYKGVRPDPIKLMEEMRDAGATMRAAEIECDQIIAEMKAFEERNKPEREQYNEDGTKLNQQLAEAREAYGSTRNAMMNKLFVCLEALIEDMKA